MKPFATLSRTAEPLRALSAAYRRRYAVYAM